MFEDIQKNKMKSWFIVLLFLVFISFIVYYICLALDLGPTSIIIAMIFSIATTWGSYYYSDKIVLSLNKARPATEEENLRLVNILEALVVSSGLNAMPKLYIVEDSQPNAFATGRNPENAVICLTTGIIDKLDKYELEGVIAHELSHIKNYDILLSTVISVFVGLVVILSDFFSRWMFRSSRRDNDNNSSSAIFALIAIVFLILSPIFATLMQLLISRKREYLADASAVELTRNPDGLINALIKISSDDEPIETANKSTAHLYIVNPFKEKRNKSKDNLMSTHPSLENRINALRNIK